MHPRFSIIQPGARGLRPLLLSSEPCPEMLCMDYVGAALEEARPPQITLACNAQLTISGKPVLSERVDQYLEISFAIRP
jgi:hypothetical protein